MRSNKMACTESPDYLNEESAISNEYEKVNTW